MKQQVNLFQPIFRRERRILTGKAIVQALLLAVFGLLGIYGYGVWQVQDLKGQVQSLEVQRVESLSRLEGLARSLPRKTQSQRLVDEIARVSRLVREHEQLVGALGERLSAPDRGLSRYMAGLARQRVEGLWLTGLSVANGGQDIVIKGRALQPELIPLLIRKLSVEDSFAGLKFRRLNMERMGPEAPQVAFELRTSAAEDKG